MEAYTRKLPGTDPKTYLRQTRQERLDEIRKKLAQGYELVRAELEPPTVTVQVANASGALEEKTIRRYAYRFVTKGYELAPGEELIPETELTTKMG